MTNEQLDRYAERLESICSDYQQKVRELLGDVRKEIHGNPMKLVVTDERIFLENRYYKAVREVIWWTLHSDRSISERVKHGIMEKIDERHHSDFESRSLNNRVCFEMIGIYCRNIIDEKERMNNEAIIKTRNVELAKQTIPGVLSSGELHITYQKNRVQAVCDVRSLENSIFRGYFHFDRMLSDAGISEQPELKIYLHHKIRRNYDTNDLKVYAGSLKKEEGRYYLNNTILLGGNISIIEKWLKSCYAHLAGTPGHLRKDPNFPVLENLKELTQKDAERLAEIVKDHHRNTLRSERISLELIRETLGNDALDQLKNEKRLIVKSSNGINYIIRDDGEVSEGENGRRCIVSIEGNLPRYDAILAKYLAIRDRPETIKTFQEKSDNSDACENYLALFKNILNQNRRKIGAMGFQTEDFSMDFDAERWVWSMYIPLTHVMIKGGKDFTPIRAHDTENDLTMELCDRIGANKLTPEFLHSAEYMNAAFDHYLAYLERYLAWLPEYEIIRNENENRRRRGIIEMRRTQERDTQCH